MFAFFQKKKKEYQERTRKNETQDCQRSISSILDPSHSEQLDFLKIQSPRLPTH